MPPATVMLQCGSFTLCLEASLRAKQSAISLDLGFSFLGADFSASLRLGLFIHLMKKGALLKITVIINKII